MSPLDHTLYRRPWLSQRNTQPSRRVQCPSGLRRRKIMRAYMGSPESGYPIICCSPGRIHIPLLSSVNIDESTLQKQGRTWKVTSPPPRHGASGEVISICGSNPSTWDAQRWTQASIDMPHGGFIYAFGWAKWGNVLGQLSRIYKANIINKSKHSRPGPSF